MPPYDPVGGGIDHTATSGASQCLKGTWLPAGCVPVNSTTQDDINPNICNTIPSCVCNQYHNIPAAKTRTALDTFRSCPAAVGSGLSDRA